jgi:phosphoglycolate phosphatase
MIGDGVSVLVHRAFAARGGEPDGAAMADFNRDYAAHVAKASQPFPGVPEFLRAAVASGWTMAICTNKPESAARALLETLGMLPMMGAVGGGDSFPVRKPDPAHLLATLRAAGGEPGRAVMVGDHANDVVAARGAGVKSVFVTWGYGPIAMAAGADAIAPDLPALTAAIEQLVPPNL